MSAASRAAALARQRQHIRSLECQINGYKGKLAQLDEKISRLTSELHVALTTRSQENPTQSPAERIYTDILRNHGRPPQGHRYSLETLLRAREIHSVSPQAWRLIRDVLPLPGESLLFSKFTECRRIISHALQDAKRVPELLDLWHQAVPPDVTDRTFILAVDAVDFRPLVTIDETGEVHGLKTMAHLGDQDLFTQFLVQPSAFAHFLRNHWDQAYSALFAFQLQPLHPRLPCAIIHVEATINGKGTTGTIEKLLQLKTILERDHCYRICGVAFDGDSCFNHLHDQFASQWGAMVRVKRRFRGFR
jgi:hypothetical protein